MIALLVDVMKTCTAKTVAVSVTQRVESVIPATLWDVMTALLVDVMKICTAKIVIANAVIRLEFVIPVTLSGVLIVLVGAMPIFIVMTVAVIVVQHVEFVTPATFRIVLPAYQAVNVTVDGAMMECVM